MWSHVRGSRTLRLATGQKNVGTRRDEPGSTSLLDLDAVAWTQPTGLCLRERKRPLLAAPRVGDMILIVLLCLFVQVRPSAPVRPSAGGPVCQHLPPCSSRAAASTLVCLLLQPGTCSQTQEEEAAAGPMAATRPRLRQRSRAQLWPCQPRRKKHPQGAKGAGPCGR